MRLFILDARDRRARRVQERFFISKCDYVHACEIDVTTKESDIERLARLSCHLVVLARGPLVHGVVERIMARRPDVREHMSVLCWKKGLKEFDALWGAEQPREVLDPRDNLQMSDVLSALERRSRPRARRKSSLATQSRSLAGDATADPCFAAVDEALDPRPLVAIRRERDRAAWLMKKRIKPSLGERAAGGAERSLAALFQARERLRRSALEDAGSSAELAWAQVFSELSQVTFNARLTSLSKIVWTTARMPINEVTGDCKYPMGDPTDADFSLCGRPCAGSYCSEHASLVGKSIKIRARAVFGGSTSGLADRGGKKSV